MSGSLPNMTDSKSESFVRTLQRSIVAFIDCATNEPHGDTRRRHSIVFTNYNNHSVK